MSDDTIHEQIMSDVRALEAHYEQTHSRRSKILDKLERVIDSMEIDANTEKASSLEAKMTIVNTYLKTIDDTDKQKLDAVKLKVKLKAENDSQDTLKMVSNLVAEYIRKIDNVVDISNLSNSSEVGAKSHVELDQLLEAQAESENFNILDDELEFGNGGEGHKVQQENEVK